MAKKKNDNQELPHDLEEVGKMIISLVLAEEDEQERIFQVHNFLKRVYKKGRSRGEREAMTNHLQKKP